jgi:hypothetical protein
VRESLPFGSRACITFPFGSGSSGARCAVEVRAGATLGVPCSCFGLSGRELWVLLGFFFPESVVLLRVSTRE